MKRCENPYLAQQCISIRASIQNFKTGLQLASMKDDGKIDKTEAEIVKAITKDLDKLQKTLDSYSYI